MNKKDIDNIIKAICPNDEDYEKPIISPAYLKKELEALALEQEPCEDETVLRFSKGSVKYNGNGYIVYKREWLMEHLEEEHRLLRGVTKMTTNNPDDNTKMANDPDDNITDHISRHRLLKRLDRICFNDTMWGKAQGAYIDAFKEFVKGEPPIFPVNDKDRQAIMNLCKKTVGERDLVDFANEVRQSASVSPEKQEPCEDVISRTETVKRLCQLAEFMNEKLDGIGDPYIMVALFIQNHKDEFPTVTPQEPNDMTSSHSELDIYKGCIYLMNAMLEQIYEWLEIVGIDVSEMDEDEQFATHFYTTEIVERLFLWNTSHRGGISQRKKLKELGITDKAVMFDFAEWWR